MECRSVDEESTHVVDGHRLGLAVLDIRDAVTKDLDHVIRA